MAMSIIRWAIGCMAGVLVLILALPVACAEDMTIYAAGALKKALPDLLDAFERETGIHFTMRFGPSGLLHREIETGAVPDVFASAIATHTEALQRAHIMRHSHIFARNRLCVTARAGVPLDEERLLETLLDPSLRLGTSTPQADALGDYTWAVFKKAEAARPGAFQVLDAKALKLVGGELNPTKRPSAVDLLGEHGQADLFISYCTSAAATLKALPGSTSKELPPALTVSIELGIAASVKSDERAERFIQFVMGDKGQDILVRHGFIGILPKNEKRKP